MSECVCVCVATQGEEGRGTQVRTFLALGEVVGGQQQQQQKEERGGS